MADAFFNVTRPVTGATRLGLRPPNVTPAARELGVMACGMSVLGVAQLAGPAQKRKLPAEPEGLLLASGATPVEPYVQR